MADSVVKLRIDSKEYDANIKRAGQALQDYFNTVRQGGGTLEHLDEGVLEAVQSMGQMATAASSSKGQLREMTVALNDMLGQYRSLTDAERSTPLGAAMSQSISELTQRAGVLRDAMDDVNATIRLEASDTKGFDQVSAAVQGMTTAFQVGQGAAQLLGIEMDDAMKVMANLQAAMAITSGLQQAQNLLQKESALMYGVQSVQMGIAAAAQSAVAAATGSATAAQAAFNAVANANPYVLLASAVAAVGVALYAFASASNEAEEAQKALNKEIENTHNALQQIDKDTDFSVAIAEAAGKSWDEIHRLRLEAARAKLAIADLGYDKLVDSGNASDEQINKARETQQKAWDDVMKVLNEGTIRDIQKRNGTGPFKKRTTGGSSQGSKTESQAPVDSVAALEAELRSLQNAQKQVTTNAEWQKYASQIEDVNDKVNILKGNLPQNKDAIITVSAHTDGLMNALREIEGVTIDEKDVTITATTQEAFQKVQELVGDIEGTTVELVVKPVIEGNIQEVTVKGSKMVSINKQLSDSAMNFDSINDYIGGVKDMLKDADLGSELYNNLTEKLKDATTVSTLLQEMMERGLEGADLESTAQALKEKMLSPEGIDQTAVQSFLEELNKQIEESGGVKLKLNTETGEVSDDKNDKKKNGTDILSKFKDLSAGLNQVAGGLQQMGVQLPKGVSDVLGVVNGAISVIQGIGTIISVFQTSALTANTIALNALTIAVWAQVASNAVPLFANGGIVPTFAQGGLIGRAAAGMMIPGNSMSGDRLRLPVDGGRGLIGVNSGELILNKSSQNSLAFDLLSAESLVGTIRDAQMSLGSMQQGMVADALNNRDDTGGYGGMPFVSGENIVLGVNNHFKRSGQGEIVTTSMLRRKGIL